MTRAGQKQRRKTLDSEAYREVSRAPDEIDRRECRYQSCCRNGRPAARAGQRRPDGICLRRSLRNARHAAVHSSSLGPREKEVEGHNGLATCHPALFHKRTRRALLLVDLYERTGQFSRRSAQKRLEQGGLCALRANRTIIRLNLS